MENVLITSTLVNVLGKLTGWWIELGWDGEWLIVPPQTFDSSAIRGAAIEIEQLSRPIELLMSISGNVDEKLTNLGLGCLHGVPGWCVEDDGRKCLSLITEGCLLIVRYH